MTYTGTLVGTDASTENNTSSVTVQWADVGSLAAGDIALIFWGHSNSVAFNSETTKPTGFTAEAGTTDNSCVFGCWSKILTGSESGTITMQHSGSAARMNACLVVVRGYSAVHSVTVAVDTGTDGNHTAPAATPTVADVGVIIANSERVNSGSTSMTPPAGYTNAVVGSATGTGGQTVGVAYEGSAGSITGTHTASVAINPGTMTNNVAAADDVVITVLLTPAVTALSTGASLSETGTVSGAGIVGKSVGSSISATDTITSVGVVGGSSGASIAATGTISAAGSVGVAGTSSGATVTGTATTAATGVVGKATGASVSETATVTSTGVVGKATGASVTGTATVTATGVVGVSSGAAISATATIASAGAVVASALTADASITATATITAAGVVAQAVFYFTPPTVARSVPGNFWGRYSMDVGQSVVRINGTLQTLSYPWMGELIGTEGIDWFLGGRTYPVSSAVAAELNAAGYTTTS